jgi:hypothetical protein
MSPSKTIRRYAPNRSVRRSKLINPELSSLDQPKFGEHFGYFAVSCREAALCHPA